MISVSPKTRFVCPRHGDQGRFIGVDIKLVAVGDVTLPKSLETRSERRYCMACWIDMMDEFMEPLREEEVK